MPLRIPDSDALFKGRFSGRRPTENAVVYSVILLENAVNMLEK